MSRQSARTERRPPVDERLVMPGSDAEILLGKVLIVPGADPPHAMRHLNLAYLLAAHTAPGFRAALDMLTRTSATSDFAPDASVFAEGPDPETGGRRLELLAFEIVSEQGLSVPTRKARELTHRGVSRVFALVLGKERALEWDRGLGRWRPMHPDEVIDEPCLLPPLPVHALLGSTRADDVVLAALAARRPDLIAGIEARAEARGREEGRAEGEAQAVETTRVLCVELCKGLSIRITPHRALALSRASLAELRTLCVELTRERRWPKRQTSTKKR